MKEFWVDARTWKKEVVTAALESGADTIVAEESGKVKALGRVRVVAPDGDLAIGRDVWEVRIAGKESEENAAQLAKSGYVIVSAEDWTVIPLENLVAQSDRIIAAVHDAGEAELALQVLEKGVAGVLLQTGDPKRVKETGAVVHRGQERCELVPFTVTAIRPAGMGDRVCVDTCSMLKEGEGMLVGNTSSAFLLVHAETMENPYVAPRPFRVNAGAVHAYVLSPGGKTAYLSDLAAGDRVLVAEACTHHPTGEDIGRVKIPRWLRERVGGDLRVEHAAGRDFPADLGAYRLVVQCGSCMLGRREVRSRVRRCAEAGVPVTNYGLAIAWSLGIFERALGPFPAALASWRGGR